MCNRKILILGASILQLPAIIKAKEMGLEVAVADYNPLSTGIKYSDVYFNVSTIDVEAIEQLALRYRPDGIITIATDMPMRSIAVATSALGLPGISLETAIKATDKYEMIRAFDEAGVDCPWYHLISSLDELRQVSTVISYPCIMKPIDSSGSRGVHLVESEKELYSSYEYSLQQSRCGKVIVEEYLVGDEISVEIIVYKGVVHILQVTDKLTTGKPYFIEIGHSQPSKFLNEDLNRIHQLATRAVKAIGIENGAAHVEMMVTCQGPRLIELGARLGGDCITSHLVPLSTGIDMIKAVIDIAMGDVPDLTPKFSRGSAIRYFCVNEGTIVSIDGIDSSKKIKGVVDVILTREIGDTVFPIHSSVDRVGMVIASGNTALDAVNSCVKAESNISICVK